MSNIEIKHYIEYLISKNPATFDTKTEVHEVPIREPLLFVNPPYDLKGVIGFRFYSTKTQKVSSNNRLFKLSSPKKYGPMYYYGTRIYLDEEETCSIIQCDCGTFAIPKENDMTIDEYRTNINNEKSSHKIIKYKNKKIGITLKKQP